MKKLFTDELISNLINEGKKLSETSNKSTIACCKIILASQDKTLTLYPFAILPDYPSKVQCLCKSNTDGQFTETMHEIEFLEKVFCDYSNGIRMDNEFSPMMINSIAFLDEGSIQDEI